MTDDYYRTYKDFKAWHAAPDASHDLFYSMETADLGLRPGAKVVELGFGEGRFLDFARRIGCDVRGLELIPDFVDQVRARGHVAEVGQRLSQCTQDAGSVDLIAAIDVVEHLTLNELRQFFEDAKALLKPGGHIFLRFPNGNSPFSMEIYNADVTHRLHLNWASLAQISGPLGLQIVRVKNPAREMTGSFAFTLKRRLQFCIRDALEYMIGFAYFGRRVPLDVNLVAILRKP